MSKVTEDVRRVFREEQTRPDREQCVFFKNIPLTWTTDQLVQHIATHHNIPVGELISTPLGKATPPTAMRLKTSSKEVANQVLGGMRRLKATYPVKFGQLSARPDYSPTELQQFRELWHQAFERNNEAGKKVCIVRNLRIVELKEEQTWTPKNFERNVTVRKSSLIKN